MKGGQVIGATDKTGGVPDHAPRYTPADVAATIYAALGIDPAPCCTTARAAQSRCCPQGRPIPGVL